jgi:hypothetical protein
MVPSTFFILLSCFDLQFLASAITGYMETEAAIFGCHRVAQR